MQGFTTSPLAPVTHPNPCSGPLMGGASFPVPQLWDGSVPCFGWWDEPPAKTEHVLMHYAYTMVLESLPWEKHTLGRHCPFSMEQTSPDHPECRSQKQTFVVAWNWNWLSYWQTELSREVDLQCCASLCCVTKWLSYTHINIGFLIFFSILVYPKRLDMGPCAVR